MTGRARRGTGPRHHARPWAILLLLVVAACGIPLDGEPRAIDPNAIGLDTTTTTTTTEPEPATGPEIRVMSLYFVGPEERLVKSDRAVEQALSEQLVLSELLGGVSPDERDADLFSAIPEGTQLLGTTRDGTRVTVDLSEGINSITGTRLTQAFAQMVYTVTALPDVESVRFAVDGELLSVPTDAADESVVTPADYASLAPE